MHRDRRKQDLVAQEARRVDVARLYARGIPQPEIGRRLGLNQSTISRDLAAIRAAWQRVMAAEFDRLKAEQLAKIDAVEAAAWEGWERSCRDAERTRTRKTTGPDGESVEASRTVTGQAGDPRFLQLVDTCIDRRLRLLGAYPKADAPPPPVELVIRAFAPGTGPDTLHGGRVLDAFRGRSAN